MWLELRWWERAAVGCGRLWITWGRGFLEKAGSWERSSWGKGEDQALLGGGVTKSELSHSGVVISTGASIPAGTS